MHMGSMPRYPSFYLGLDLGKQRDYTALAVIEEALWIGTEQARWDCQVPTTGWVSPATIAPEHRERAKFAAVRPTLPPLAVRHLERFPLGTKYPAIVERVTALMASPPLVGDAALVVDGTGVGAPVTDLFRLAGRPPGSMPLADVTITGGTAVGVDVDSTYRYTVPKRDLVSTLQALLQSDRLKIAAGLPDAQTLVDELLSFEVTITEAAHDTYEGRKGAHDDLVLAVAMPCWFRGYMMTNLDRAYALRAVRENAATEV